MLRASPTMMPQRQPRSRSRAAALREVIVGVVAGCWAEAEEASVCLLGEDDTG